MEALLLQFYPSDGLLMNPFEFPVKTGDIGGGPPHIEADNPPAPHLLRHTGNGDKPPGGTGEEGVLPHKCLRMAQAPGALHELDLNATRLPLDLLNIARDNGTQVGVNNGALPPGNYLYAVHRPVG